MSMSRYRSIGILGVVALVCGLVLVAAPASAARDRTPPTTPTNLRITATTANSVSLAWSASTDTSTFWYCVQTSGSGCIRVDPPRTTLTRIISLPNTTFTFSVYAVDAAGNRSASGNTVSFTTQADIAPPRPAPVISVTKLFPTRVVLTWPLAVDDFGSQIWYTLFVDGSPYLVDTGATVATLFTLTPDTTYVFQVSARDRDRNVATGPSLVVRTPAKTDEQAPTAPTGLHVDSPDGLDLRMRWNASTDDTDPQSEIRYDVYLDGVRAALGLGTLTWGSCESNAPVAIFVRAVDTSGNASEPSDTLIFDECNP
jgi:chitodextrinase